VTVGDPREIIDGGWAAACAAWREIAAALGYTALRTSALRSEPVSVFVARVIRISEVAEQLRGQFVLPALVTSLPLLEQLSAEASSAAAEGEMLLQAYPDEHFAHLVACVRSAARRLEDFVRLAWPWLQGHIVAAAALTPRA